MKVLVVPMLARSQMGGPWSRAKRVAHAFRDGGHEVTLAWGGRRQLCRSGRPNARDSGALGARIVREVEELVR